MSHESSSWPSRKANHTNFHRRGAPLVAQPPKENRKASPPGDTHYNDSRSLTPRYPLRPAVRPWSLSRRWFSSVLAWTDGRRRCGTLCVPAPAFIIVSGQPRLATSTTHRLAPALARRGRTSLTSSPDRSASCEACEKTPEGRARSSPARSWSRCPAVRHSRYRGHQGELLVASRYERARRIGPAVLNLLWYGRHPALPVTEATLP